ncbi:MAG: ATP-binding cassette domain-containing protein [Actinomycetota bacterium]|nr:ATP-binding cassette domain-containing protein [Actinomycetota bacterium]
MSLSVPLPVLVLGLVTGLTYGILAIGLILVYRSSRVLNLAHGQVGAFAASVFGVYVVRYHLPYWALFPVALALGAGTNMVVEVIAVRRLRKAPAMMSLIATLGAAAFLLAMGAVVNTSIHNGASFPQPPGLPHLRIGAFLITPAYAAQLLVTPVLVVALAAFLRWSRYGIAIRAAADNRDNATMRGIAPGRMSLLAWGLAGAVSAYAALLQFPSQGFALAGDSLGPGLLVRALLIAVLARLDKLPIALGAGLVLGVIEQVLLFNNPSGGTVEVIIFVGMMVALLVQPRQGGREREQGSFLAVAGSRPLPEAMARLPLVRNLGRIGTLGIMVFLGLFLLGSNASAFTMTRLVGYTLVGLSVYVISGLGGQLSLGQFALAGIGAVFSYHMTKDGTNFVLALFLASCYTAGVSVLLGLPALRIKGLLLTVSTLAFAVTCQYWLFARSWTFGEGVAPKQPVAPFLGALTTGKQYYLVALPALMVGLWLTWNVSRGGLRRSLVGLRDNEDGARAFTLPATRLKLQAFAVAGFLAGLGGAVYGHSLPLLSQGTFPATESITVVALAVIGGISLMAGAFLGALYLIAVPAFVPLDAAGLAASSLGWLLLILYFPGGLVQLLQPVRERLVDVISRRAGLDPAALRAAHGDEQPGLPVARPRAAPRALRVPASGPVLVVHDVAKSFGGIHAVQGVSVEVHAGEILGLIGPNGAGKTTLFEILSGFTRQDRGRVVFGGRDISALPPEQRARLGLVRSFQDARLFPTLTVLDTVRLSFERAQPTQFMPSVLGLRSATRAERQRDARARDTLSAMGLDRYRDKSIAELSTGTRRITELACLCAMEPTLLLLDEPASGIAQRESEALGELIRTLRDVLSATIVVIEHDMPLIMGMSDRILAMETGRAIALGDPATVCSDPQVIESYLGGNALAIQRSGTTPTQLATA